MRRCIRCRRFKSTMEFARRGRTCAECRAHEPTDVEAQVFERETDSTGTHWRWWCRRCDATGRWQSQSESVPLYQWRKHVQRCPGVRG